MLVSPENLKNNLAHGWRSPHFWEPVLQFQQVKRIIYSLCYQLENYYDFSATPIEKFKSSYKILDDLAHLPMGDHLVKLILEDPEIITILPTIRRFYGNFLFCQEIDLAKEIISSSDSWHTLYNYSLFPRYQKLICQQGKGANLKKDDIVAFIGGGAVPITLILLHKVFGVTGISIEVHPEIASISQKVIEKLGIAENIKIIAGDETTLEGQKFTAIMVAALAQPKKRIFQYLRTILDENAHVSISYRTYTGMRMLLYDPVSESDLEGFEEIKRIFPKDQVNNTICFIKKVR